MFKERVNNIKIDLAVGSVILCISFWLFGKYDVFEKIIHWAELHEEYEVDELITSSMVLVILGLLFSIRRHKESRQKTRELQKALDEIAVLQGIIPICSYCKCIRDDKGSWGQLENYVRSHSQAEFSHGICPDCYDKEIREMDALEGLQSNKG